MRSIGLMVFMVLIVFPPVGGCGAAPAQSGDTSAQLQIDAETPEEVIREYFFAVGRHDQDTRAALSSTYRRDAVSRVDYDESSEVEFDMSNLVVSATQLATGLANRPERLRNYYAVRSGSVEYVQLEDSRVSRAGPKTRFVTVVKETASSPWRVDEIGTGP